ncbi:hypothetical protein A3I99_02600 [Candidatus Kaiserbacteria bacterium RIFCSPLOWO2_02_FULL_45_11b]|uniref:Uncharacterized protein n=1 Tax=Candidatus Kaiserbacteria bacterium RIFCSPLOWO2_12_FULL_45_26 TaxID=1798525 RepID=A0A1F6FFB3_9BACT|nr:MAG: hypothetical protein A2Z56_01790 [Candidatus Kaiserbacteria bacterium RIFCSPHIGHO2_12_45_16]OGG70276.1 MAG: hypothetical protein A2929_04345 [Candidatus Kaiserbacteria bacterium RIFCSPLOWO2_01_FULL_45_25]OGG81944.1 MAG: hypothetical protein A3I99_02600 [Candidatus Kaiserbacteria bacterium RIFCSPLOWO2_02_FULL_45_11b]OGG84540.1 MAG: hypothetical protein A3G90_00390 [Candidatus Kaiserbacteria bacterium RIFCSPLOWO2_12_FULL_45_26]
MFATVRLQNAVKIAQYEFFDGQIGGKITFDHNHRLLLRVVDHGFVSRHNKTQQRLMRRQEKYAHSTLLGFIKDWAAKSAKKNSCELREFLRQKLEEGKVYRQALNLQTGNYYFRPVNAEELPALRQYLACEHKYHLYICQAEEATAVTLVHLSTFPV